MTDVCGTCGHGHTTDLSSLNASACADHTWTDACPYNGIACPPAVERADIISDLSRRYDAHLSDLFAKYPPQIPGVLRKPVDWQAEISGWKRKIAEVPPVRTEPIKLTPDQWVVIKAANPPLADRPINPLYRPLGDLMGITVVMVNTEAESTPVVGGWIKPKRPESRRERRKRLGLHWWQRSRS